MLDMFNIPEPREVHGTFRVICSGIAGEGPTGTMAIGCYTGCFSLR
jgi:hypothetical protein